MQEEIFSPRRRDWLFFNDRSFVTDNVIYRKKGKITNWTKDEEGNDYISDTEKEAYLEKVQQDVKDRYQFSAYILQENYYQDIEAAVSYDK
ncbi:MAG: hypothetical protein IJF07_09900 [Lachnospiraceae bacterium]|nr:hypothetical protein [Lachnospiraceae bacterium]